MLARSVATLDILSGGRVELGLGAGAFWDAIVAMDGPRRTPGEAVTSLREAMSVLRALWSPGERVHIQGKHYRLEGARPGPVPAHPVGIWLGVYGARALRLTGRLADGWLGSAAYVPPSGLGTLMRTIDEAATAAGRSPSAVRRVYIVDTGFTAADLAELTREHGVSGFLMNVAPGDSGALMRFAGETVPAVRAAVAEERGEAPAQAVWADPADRPVDPAGRPRAKGRPARQEPSTAGRRAAATLVTVHDHLRAELDELQRVVTDVLAGRDEPAAARSLLNTMTLRQNYWSLGAFCATYCRLVTNHHLLEDEVMFPRLREAEPDLAPVLDRLEKEHDLIAGLIVRLDLALVAMVDDPSRLEEVRRVLDRLGECLLSHLSYEEEQLLGPIAEHSVVV
ncbi:LLM class flavin-dependent oxidoreductase [Streptomyces sp. JJ38]|uniref:LLM class flavin-dependent oxidoreductase n=1 Tax=Streptomyces sp. JJ38 TaxID=2738128 RepID=UPI0027DEAFDC|nr:LLM class flavin-dependent oxidoreductase [Streptomyces sp. JJ38]